MIRVIPLVLLSAVLACAQTPALPTQLTPGHRILFGTSGELSLSGVIVEAARVGAGGRPRRDRRPLLARGGVGRPPATPRIRPQLDLMS
jgi:hypothetical protein